MTLLFLAAFVSVEQHTGGACRQLCTLGLPCTYTLHDSELHARWHPITPTLHLSAARPLLQPHCTAMARVHTTRQVWGMATLARRSTARLVATQQQPQHATTGICRTQHATTGICRLCGVTHSLPRDALAEQHARCVPAALRASLRVWGGRGIHPRTAVNRDRRRAVPTRVYGATVEELTCGWGAATAGS